MLRPGHGLPCPYTTLIPNTFLDDALDCNIHSELFPSPNRLL
jgi:hypothetical protein